MADESRTTEQIRAVARETGIPGDYPVEEVLANMEHWASKGALCFVKYTCVHCGSRQTADEPNTWHAAGYICEECGGLTVPKAINMLLALGAGPAPLEKV